MRKSKIIFIISILLSLTSICYAGQTNKTLIKAIVWADPSIHPKEGVEIWLADATNAGEGACLNLHSVVLLLTDDPRFKEKYSMLLTAYTSSKSVRIYSYQCVTYGAHEYGIVQSVVFSEELL